jgi:hypothetical protein
MSDPYALEFMIPTSWNKFRYVPFSDEGLKDVFSNSYGYHLGIQTISPNMATLPLLHPKTTRHHGPNLVLLPV